MTKARAYLFAVFSIAVACISGVSVAEPIRHEVSYPNGSGPFPAVITLHTSGGFKAMKNWVENFKSQVWTNAGYVV